MMFRTNYRAWLIPYLEGSLDPQRTARLQRRLRIDPALAAEADDLRRIVGAVRSAADASPAPTPTWSIWPRVELAIRRYPALRAILTPGSAAVAGTVALAAVLAASVSWRGQTGQESVGSVAPASHPASLSPMTPSRPLLAAGNGRPVEATGGVALSGIAALQSTLRTIMLPAADPGERIPAGPAAPGNARIASVPGDARRVDRAAFRASLRAPMVARRSSSMPVAVARRASDPPRTILLASSAHAAQPLSDVASVADRFLHRSTYGIGAGGWSSDLVRGPAGDIAFADAADAPSGLPWGAKASAGEAEAVPTVLYESDPLTDRVSRETDQASSLWLSGGGKDRTSGAIELWQLALIDIASSTPAVGQADAMRRQVGVLENARQVGALPTLLDECEQQVKLEQADPAVALSYWRVIGLIYEVEEQYSDAVATWSHLVLTGSATGEDWYHLGLCRERVGDAAGTAWAYNKALVNVPSGSDHWQHMAAWMAAHR